MQLARPIVRASTISCSISMLQEADFLNSRFPFLRTLGSWKEIIGSVLVHHFLFLLNVFVLIYMQSVCAATVTRPYCSIENIH